MAAEEEARSEYQQDFMKDMCEVAELSNTAVEELIERAKLSLQVLKDRKAKCQLELEEFRLKNKKISRKVSKGGRAKNRVDSKTTDEKLIIKGPERGADEESNKLWCDNAVKE